MMEGIGTDLIDNVRKKISSGKECRVFFDNIHFNVLVNIEQKNYRNSDIHWIARHLTFDKVPSNYLEDLTPLVQNLEILTILTIR